jgi:hypothetical protein
VTYKVCSTVGCRRKAHARGFCSPCHGYWSRAKNAGTLTEEQCIELKIVPPKQKPGPKEKKPRVRFDQHIDDKLNNEQQA